MSAPVQTTMSVQNFLTKNGIAPMPHPPYSPDHAPSNFLLISPHKKVLKGKCFANVEEVKQKTAETVEGIKIDKFKHCFEQWKKVSQ